MKVGVSLVLVILVFGIFLSLQLISAADLRCDCNYCKTINPPQSSSCISGLSAGSCPSEKTYEGADYWICPAQLATSICSNGNRKYLTNPTACAIDCDDVSGHSVAGYTCTPTVNGGGCNYAGVEWFADPTCGCTSRTWYLDADNDNWYSSTNSGCTSPGVTWKDDTEIDLGHSGDCNDANSNINPGVEEQCNGIDDNCNSLIDENNACCPFSNRALCSGLISFWPLDISTGSSNTLAVDVWGGNNGTSINLSQVTSGVKGQAYNFTGNKNAQVVIANEQNFDFLNTSSFTLSFWIYSNGSQFNAVSKTKPDYSPPDNPANSNMHVYLDADQKINFNFYNMQWKVAHPWSPADKYVNTWVINTNTYTSDNPIRLNKWNNIIVSFNYSNCSSINVYLNGQRIAGSWQQAHFPHVSQCGGCYDYSCSAAGTQWHTFWPPLITPSPNDNPFIIGSNSALIDEIAIWRRLLTFGEISELNPNDTLSIKKVYWSDLNDDAITNADFGDTVKMNIEGNNLTSMRVNYSVFRGSLNLYSNVSLAGSSDYGFNFWRITNPSSIGNGVYFNASLLNNLRISNFSSSLTIGSVSSNNLPDAKIILPINDSIVVVATPISFKQRSQDKDDLLDITWNFGDRNISIYRDYSFGDNPAIADEDHVYYASGTYFVNLNAKESIRNQEDNDYRFIYVFGQGVNVIPVVSLPLPNSNYIDTVNFDISQSYVVNCSNVSSGIWDFNVTCNTFGCGGITYYCSYLHRPGVINTTGYNIGVSWNLSGSTQNLLNGNWQGNYSRVVKFAKMYSSSGSYSAELSLIFNLNGINYPSLKVRIPFSVLVANGWRCVSNATAAFWVNNTQSINAITNCRVYNSTLFPSCCPTDYSSCEANGRCNLTSVVTKCSDLTTQASCLSASNAIAQATLGSAGGNCGNLWTNSSDNCNYNVLCNCLWNGSSCNSARANYSQLLGSCPRGGHCDILASFLEDNCATTSTILQKTVASWSNGAGDSHGCINETIPYPCIYTAKLDFTTNASVVIIVLLIIGGYIYLVRKRKLKKVKRAKK